MSHRLFPSPHRDLLRERLATPFPALHLVVGPAGSGKTVLLRQVFQGRSSGADDTTGEVLFWEVPPLEEGGLLADLDALVGVTLGALPPVPLRPELLPLPGSVRPWVERLEGIAAALTRLGGGLAPGRHAGVLVLDGVEHLGGARRRLADELLDAWRRMRDRGVPLHLVATWQGSPPEAWSQEGTTVALDLHPFRPAAWGHPSGVGPRTSSEAFARWAVFGQHPTGLPGNSGERKQDRSWTLEGELMDRVLDPAGDLFDAPLRRLASRVQVPRRYVEILQAMAAQGAASGWGPVAERVGSLEGNRLAPYLQRLSDEGWIQVLQPLDGRPGGRRRRYALADPFTAFWFRFVFPLRSLLHREDPRGLFRRRILPQLDEHLASWLPVLARRWLRSHATERLPAPAREVGGLWAGEVEIPVAARLANGQVCYGLTSTPWTSMAGPELLDSLRGKMTEARWGIGREARAPLLFVAGPVDPELRRRVATIPLARLLTLDDLMGASPPGASS